MKLIFPPEAATAAERLRHVHRLRERLRRRNNWYVARADAAEARRWHRQWFLPRNRAVTDAELRLRRQVHGTWRPADENEAPPWIPDRRRIRKLADDAGELEGITLAEAFEGEAATAEPPDPTEDLTTYTVSDPDSDFTITASTVLVDTIKNNPSAHAYVYADKGAGHFGSAWEWDFDLKYPIATSEAGVCGVLNAANLTTEGCHDWQVNLSQAYGVLAHRYWKSLRLYNWESGSSFDESFNLTLQQWYYCTFERTGDTAGEVRIYTDASRTTLLDTVTEAPPSGRTYRYIFVINSWEYGSTQRTSVDVANVDLHEAAAAGLPIPVAMHHYTQLRGDA